MKQAFTELCRLHVRMVLSQSLSMGLIRCLESVVWDYPKDSCRGLPLPEQLQKIQRFMCLMTVIQHNEGGANKDLANFADQINALCDKWDRL